MDYKVATFTRTYDRRLYNKFANPVGGTADILQEDKNFTAWCAKQALVEVEEFEKSVGEQLLGNGKWFVCGVSCTEKVCTVILCRFT